MAQLESHKEEIEASGLNVVAIAMAEPKHARRYCGKLTADVDCYCNRAGDVYQAYGVGRMGIVSGLLNRDMYKAGSRAAMAGFAQGKATGDIRMLPGTFIVDSEGKIQFTHYSTHAGDHPDLAQLLQLTI